jgi:23S rRNA-/tRNA-specific pseudouridylate synthase
VLYAAGGVIALEKPPRVVWERDKFNAADGIYEAFRSQLAGAKPELMQLGISDPASIWPVEKEIAGIGLIVERGPIHQHLRNAFGSACLKFSYEFLATDQLADDFAECTLPVAEHFNEPKVIVSHVTGKKSATMFRRLSRNGRWSWWEASADYPRWHQVRLHAAELGMKIVGETLYAQGDSIMLSQVMPGKRLNKGDDRPLYEGICLRMTTVDCSRARIEGLDTLTAIEPDKWAVLRKRLAALRS